LRTVEQLEELRNAGEWISKWHFKSKQKTTVVKQTLPFKEGLIMTVNALHSVCQKLLMQHNFRFVLTSRFN